MKKYEYKLSHGILLHIGRQDLMQDEDFVQAMGNAIYQSFEPKIEKINKVR